MDLALKIITALATVTIGIAASILAYQQYKISKAKLRFDLYDKRLTLFNRLRDYASEVAMTSKDGLEILDDAGKFYRDTIECQFLFDDMNHDWGQACDFAILQQYSARSARQHKAWGVSPRIAIGKNRKNPRSG
ncbi:MAG TPA: hypothetical protein VEM96_10750 [Pyrinomonadaceae bacterium]|nr:hypothetical protein [Pyrinomonadaceae bacterium]